MTFSPVNMLSCKRSLTCWNLLLKEQIFFKEITTQSLALFWQSWIYYTIWKRCINWIPVIGICCFKSKLYYLIVITKLILYKSYKTEVAFSLCFSILALTLPIFSALWRPMQCYFSLMTADAVLISTPNCLVKVYNLFWTDSLITNRLLVYI